MPTQTPQTLDTSPRACTVLLFARAKITKTTWSFHGVRGPRRSLVLCQLFVWADMPVKKAKTNPGWSLVWIYRLASQSSTTAMQGFAEFQQDSQLSQFKASGHLSLFIHFYSKYKKNGWHVPDTGGGVKLLQKAYRSKAVTGSSNAKTLTLFWCPPVLHFCALLTPCSNPPWLPVLSCRSCPWWTALCCGKKLRPVSW